MATSKKQHFLLSFASSLRGRLLILVCLATLPALFFTLYAANNERYTTLERSQKEARYIADLISREHTYQIAGARSLLEWLSLQLQNSDTTGSKHDSGFLSAILSGYPQLANIAILNTSGDVVISARNMAAPVNMRDYDAIGRALQSTNIESGRYAVGPIVKRPLLHMAKSLRNRHGELSGVVFVALDLDYFKKLFAQIDLPDGYSILVIDRQGTVLASSGKNAPAVGQVISSLDPNKNQADRRRLESHFVTRPMSDIPGLRIVTRIPSEQIYAQANATFLRMLLILSVLTIITAALVVIVEEVSLLRYLRALGRATRRFGAGNYAVRVQMPRNYGELEKMAAVFNSMAEALQQRHRELREAHEQLDKLTRHLHIARESESLRIARELHDEVGQVLTSIKMDLRGFSKCCYKVEPSCQRNIDTIAEKIDGLVAFIREIASSLRPPVLDRMGLVKALELLARNSEKCSDLIIDLDADLTEPLDWLTSITVYRIVQESINNIIKHANASLVNINLSMSDNTIHLRITDDGVGFDESLVREDALGIIGMKERARLINGQLAIYAEPAKGTCIEATIPAHTHGDCYAYPVG